jgi:hypothetical protein
VSLPLGAARIGNWRRLLVEDSRVAVYEGSGDGWHVVVCTLHDGGIDPDATATAVHGASGQVVLLPTERAKALRRQAKYTLTV